MIQYSIDDVLILNAGDDPDRTTAAAALNALAKLAIEENVQEALDFEEDTWDRSSD